MQENKLLSFIWPGLDDILYQHFLYSEALELLKQTVLEILIDLHSKEIEYLPTVFGADGIGQLLYLYLLLHPAFDVEVVEEIEIELPRASQLIATNRHEFVE